jgi:hypothetical protein
MNDNKDSAKKNFKNIITVVLVLIIAAVVLLVKNTSNVKITNEGLKVSSMYSLDLKYEEIEEISLKDSLPERFNKTNGIDLFGAAEIGNFKARNMDKIKAFVQGKDAPFIYLTVKNKDYNYVIINTKNKQQTEDMFKEISLKIKNGN